MHSVHYLFERMQSVDAQMRMCRENLDEFLRITNSNDIYWSPKIDGVRCWAVVSKRTIPEKSGFRKIADISYLSRNNKHFPNLERFNDSIIEMAHVINREYRIKYPVIIDMEVSSKDRKLSSVMTQLRRMKSMNPEHFILNVFDIAISNIPFTRRYNILESAAKSIEDKSIRLVPYRKLRDASKHSIHELKDQMIEKYGYEGVMLIDGSSDYQFNRRSKNCVKVKGKDTMDLEIIDIKLGEPGTRWEGAVSALVLNYEGQPITVSGRIDRQMREQWAKNPKGIIGKKAEIEYKEITNKGQLREPVFVRLREDK